MTGTLRETTGRERRLCLSILSHWEVGFLAFQMGCEKGTGFTAGRRVLAENIMDKTQRWEH